MSQDRVRVLIAEDEYPVSETICRLLEASGCAVAGLATNGHDEVEIYILEHSEADFTHGTCPDCAKKLYPSHYNAHFGPGV